MCKAIHSLQLLTASGIFCFGAQSAHKDCEGSAFLLCKGWPQLRVESASLKTRITVGGAVAMCPKPRVVGFYDISEELRRVVSILCIWKTRAGGQTIAWDSLALVPLPQY